MPHRFLVTLMILVMGFSLSCAGSGNPVQAPNAFTPDATGQFQFTTVDENTLMLGAWDVYIDLENLSVEAIPLRSVDMHVNVSPMILPPKCYNCFLAKNLIWDPVEQIVTIDIGFRNPSNIKGYDVRGIITSFPNKEFLNPDGYTMLFTPVPGLMNPFVAYNTGIGQREFPALTDQFETLMMHVPTFPSFQPFTYIVEASWPDNCKEPYEILPSGISGNIFNDGSNSPLLQVRVHDWQNNVESVAVDLSPIGGAVTPMTQNGSIPDIWEANISCAPGTLVDTYKLLVKATTAAPSDQTADMYNYVSVKVVIPPSPEAEVFNPAEHVAATPGESFVWPRHSISVTSDGVSHAVWVDNSPDPDSNVFHVYYSKREFSIWTTPQQIDDSSGNAIYATIAADQTDRLHVVWEDQRDYVLGSDIYYASSIDNFATSAVILTGEDGLRNVHPKIEIGDDGSMHLAWHTQEYIEPGVYEYDAWYMHKPFGNPSWEPATAIANSKNIAEAFPSVTARPDESAYYAYQSDATGIHGIYFTKNTPGFFTTPVPVVLNDSFQPAMDVGPDGNIIIAYFDSTDTTFTDIYARMSNNAGDTWGDPFTISESQDAFQYAPDVECTDEGDIHFAWHEEDETGRPGRVLYREYLITVGLLDIIELEGTGKMGAFPSMDSDLDGHIHVIYELLTPTGIPGEDNYDIWYRDSVS